MKRYQKIALRVVWMGLGVFVLASLLVFILVQIPVVQKYVAQTVVEQVQRDTGAEVSLGSVRINWLQEIELRELYVSDLQCDTLLYGEVLQADIRLWSLLYRVVRVEGIRIDQGRIRLVREAGETEGNYQFLLDAFASDSAASEVPAVWKYQIDALSLHAIDFSSYDAVAKQKLTFASGDLELQTRGPATDFSRLDFLLIHLKNTDVRLSSWAYPIETTDSPPSMGTGIPRLAIALSADRLLLENCRIRYDGETLPRVEGGFDPAHLELSEIELEIADFEYVEGRLKMNLEELAFRERKGFRLRHMAAQLEGDALRLAVQDLELQSTYSRLEASLEMQLDSLPGTLPELTIHLSSSAVSTQDIRYFFPDIAFFNEENPGLIQLTGKVSGSTDQLNIEELRALAPGLLLDMDARLMHFSVDSLRSVEIRLHELSGDYAAVYEWAPGLPLSPVAARLGKVLLQGNASGRVADLYLDSLVLKTESQTNFLIGGHVRNLFSADSLRYVAEVLSFQTSYADLNGLLPGKLPAQLAGLGLLSYEGLLRGSAESLSLNGLLRSAAGPLVAKFTTRFPATDSLIGYEGFLASTGWDLGLIAGDSSRLGPIAFELEVKGRGFDPRSMEAVGIAQVYSLVSGDYVFRNFQGNAAIRDQRGVADFSLTDPNLALSFVGEMDFHDSLPVFDVTAAIDTANLFATGLMDRDLRGRMKFRLNGQGNRPGNFVGSALLTGVNLRANRLLYREDTLRIRAQNIGPFRQLLEVHSDVLTARLEGRYFLGELSASLLAFMQPYFNEGKPAQEPVSGDSVLSPPRIAPQQWALEVHLHDAKQLAQILIPNLVELDSAYLNGSYDSETRQLDFQGKIPKLAYGGSGMENLNLKVTGSPEHFSGRFTSDTAHYSPNLIFPATQLLARLDKGHILLDLGLTGDSLQERFAVHTDIFRKDSLSYLRIQEPLVFEYDTWAVDTLNLLAFDSAYVAVHDLIIRKGEQKIEVESEGEIAGQPPLRLDFSRFDVAEVNNLTGNGDWQLGGEMNGTVTIYDLFQSPYYASRIRVNELVLNAEPMGDLYVNLELDRAERIIALYARVDGDTNQLTAAGVYRLEAGELEARAAVERLSMRFLQGFVPELISDSEGLVKGDFSLTGPAKLPRLAGELELQGVATRIRYTGTKYRMDAQKLLLTGNTISFPGFQFSDTLGNIAYMQGTIDYAEPANMRYDLDISSDRILVLNTEKGADPLYYGNIFLSMNAQLEGNSLRPELVATARTLSGTHLVTIPLGEEDEIQQEAYIVFGKPPDVLKAEGIEPETGPVVAAKAAVNMDLKLQLTRDAQLEVIIDPIGGDKVVCQGDADLLVQLDRSGDLSVIGSYVIDKGSYDFSYQNLLKKKFSVQQGSRIDFPGDPLQAVVDITALYQARTSTYELISSQATALSDDELRQARQKVPVEAVLKLSGVLFQPVIAFDILLPESQQSVLSSAVERKLSEIRQDESEMSKQVFGLLLFNTFLLSDRSAGLSLGTAGGEAALSSLSNLITSQLNQLASRYVKGVDIAIGLDTYSASDQGGLSNRVTDMQLGVSKQLLDDRLSISVGGNMSLNNETTTRTTDNENFTQFTGDFVIEYKLTEKGRYRVKVFSKSDYDMLNASNVNKTGVGLYYRESFDKLGEKKRARQNANLTRP